MGNADGVKQPETEQNRTGWSLDDLVDGLPELLHAAANRFQGLTREQKTIVIIIAIFLLFFLLILAA